MQHDRNIDPEELLLFHLYKHGLLSVRPRNDTLPNQPKPQKEERCSFCGKSQRNVQRLFQSYGGANICNECIALCQKIMAEESRMGPKR